MTTSNDSTTKPQKRCTKCKVEYPATTEHFSPCRGGLQSQCRICRKAWHLANRDKELERMRQSRLKNKQARREYDRRYTAEHSEWKRDYNRRYKAVRRNETRQYMHQWRVKNTGKISIANRNRRANLNRLASTFTDAQWQVCLEYFNHTCAYCGAQQSFWFALEQDHVIPVTSGGGYTADNIVPACKSCNSSKSNNDLSQWLVTKLGARKAKKVLQRVTDYLANEHA